MQKKDKISQVENFAKLDILREQRCGSNEVVFCEGKTNKELQSIVERFLQLGHKNILLTRLDESKFNLIKNEFSQHKLLINDRAKSIIINYEYKKITEKQVLVVSAGTADLKVAEEAVMTLSAFGIESKVLYDVGVAGIDRLLENKTLLRQSDFIIVVAGMEGALASVVGGLVKVPVVAVPTSVGYGANFGGLSALCSMLTSCASGITVVNIDNGFGAGYAVLRFINATQN